MCDSQIYHVKKMVLKINNNRDNNVINNIMTAVVLCFTLINGAIGISGASFATIFVMVSLFFVGMLKKKTHLYVKPIFIAFTILLIFICSFLFISNTSYTMQYFLNFISMGMISMFIGRQEIVVEKVIYYLEVIGALCLIVYLVRGFEQYDVSLVMGVTYSMLPVFFAACIELLCIKKHKVMALCLIVVTMSVYIQHATRGLWLVIVISIFIYIFIAENKMRQKNVRFIVLAITTIIAFVAIVFIIENLAVVLSVANEVVCFITGSRIYAIDKAIYLINTDNVGNGRDELILFASELIKDSPILGNGIGRFEALHGGSYIHNIIYQGLCEVGLVFVFPLCFIVTKVLKCFFREENIQETLYLLLIVANGLIMLFFSSTYWKNFAFWLLVGYLLKSRNGEIARK